MSAVEYAVLREEDGTTFVVALVDQQEKIKGIGVFNPLQTLSNINIGEIVTIGQKQFQRLPPRLPELNKGMARRAQTISSKDAGFFITRLGIGPGDVVLEAGIGSGGLSLHLARVLSANGTLITVEPRDEHAEIGLKNLERAKASWIGFPDHHHISGRIEDVAEQIGTIKAHIDAIVLDLPEHPSAILTTAPLLQIGGRLACYCPVSTQLEEAWVACEQAGLTVEWAGELMEREWGRASKGGLRPVNGPFGHTAFLLIALRNS